MEQMDRKTAQSLGLTRFYPGSPCSKGHIGPRYTRDNVCCECKRASFHTWKAANREKRLAYQREHQPEYRRRDPKRWNAYSLARHYTKWASSLGQDGAVRKVYEECPEGHEVDHIVPLKGRNVCGLHVPWNLQYLTPDQNKRKSNKHGHGTGLATPCEHIWAGEVS